MLLGAAGPPVLGIGLARRQLDLDRREIRVGDLSEQVGDAIY
jgi:hypothetical protein